MNNVFSMALHRSLTTACVLALTATVTGCADEAKPAAATDAAVATDSSAGDAAKTDAGATGDAATTDSGAVSDVAAADVATTDMGVTDAVGPDMISADTGTVDTGAAAPTCEAYCKAVTTNCTAANAQYKDEADCNTYCKSQGKLPAGTANDKAENTIGCRTYHAGAAGTDAALHCPHAGKTGGNACGTWCDNYCHLVDKSCLATKQEMDTDVAGCSAKCKDIKAAGNPNDAAGDSVQCRIYHLGVAGTDEANSKIHCPHGKITPAAGTPCAPAAMAAPTCETYCKAVTMHCTAANAQYTDEAACNTYCKTQGKLPAGTADDKATNTIGCRTYHAGAAAGDAVLHCPHAGKSGGDACGTWSENYCHLAIANCMDANKIYAAAAACTAAAAAAKSDGKPNDAAGDTLQCRIYHLGVAGTDAANAAIHCPHGKVPSPAGTPCTSVVAPTTKTVKTTANNTFDPPETTINAGESVNFITTSNHNAVEVDEATYTAGGSTAKANGLITVGFGAIKTVKFDKAGTYFFVCQPHAGMGMKGKIIVK